MVDRHDGPMDYELLERKAAWTEADRVNELEDANSAFGRRIAALEKENKRLTEQLAQAVAVIEAGRHGLRSRIAELEKENAELREKVEESKHSAWERETR